MQEYTNQRLFPVHGPPVHGSLGPRDHKTTRPWATNTEISDTNTKEGPDTMGPRATRTGGRTPILKGPDTMGPRATKTGSRTPLLERVQGPQEHGPPKCVAGHQNWRGSRHQGTSELPLLIPLPPVVVLALRTSKARKRALAGRPNWPSAT